MKVMESQHRLHVLRVYIEAAGMPESDSWWMYRLPANLNIKLRVNPRDPNLPDNHGQTWTQLVSIASDPMGAASAD
ncbi:hypothetical protein COL940_014370 [Colletotrichum noveboracense]|nr:hypothetical protein COL940_014370 [Colletotrichum noveboracense]